MSRTPVRVACLVIALLATGGIGYRVFQVEHTLNTQSADARAAEAAANQIEQSLIDLRASLHAYVAPGQGLPFWAKRAQDTIESLRDNLKALDTTVAPTGDSVADSLDGLDQLAAAERRARTYVSRGELELASDVIFTEIRDVLAAATGQIDKVRTDLKARNDRELAATRQQQLMLVGAAFALWIVVALLLTPAPHRPVAKDPALWRNELKETLKKPIPVAAETPVIVSAAADAPPAAPDAPAPPAEPSLPVTAVQKVSEVCADLSAMADPNALEGALARMTTLLDATGVIVWVASTDAASLAPVATYGFDAKLVSRIGRIPRDSANLTAAAFRENLPKMSPATASAPAALAVAMCGPTGPSGVLSIELKAGQTVDDGKVALASILAAQLATLAMPVAEMPAADTTLPRQTATA